MNREEEIKASIRMIDNAIRKHKPLAAWGNVESKERLRELRQRKRTLLNQLNNK
jgi:hypothetical protein